MAACCCGMGSEKPGNHVDALRGTLVIAFVDQSVEDAFQSHRAAWFTRCGELTSRSAVGIASILLLASIAGDGALAAFQRANAFADLLLFGALALAFAKEPRRAASWYSTAVVFGVSHIVAVFSMTPNHVAALLSLRSPQLRNGLWTEANSGVMTTGLLMSVVLLSGLSLRDSLLLVHVIVALHMTLCLEADSAQTGQMAAVCVAFSRSLACLFRGACLYGFAMVAFVMRRSCEKEARLRFLSSGDFRTTSMKHRSSEALRESEVCANGKAGGDRERKLSPEMAGKASLRERCLREFSVREFSSREPSLPVVERQQSSKTEPAVLRRESLNADGIAWLAAKDTAKRVLTVPHPPELSPEQQERQKCGADGDRGAGVSEAPNAKLVGAMHGRVADWDRIRKMAANIRSPCYTLRHFFDDCVHSFPELQLFFHEQSVISGKTASSGVSNEAEYQRTIGALFAVYWLLRLQLDGRVGFCYGVDADWLPCKPKRVRSSSMGFKRVRSAEVPSCSQVVHAASHRSHAASARTVGYHAMDDSGSDTSCGTKTTVNLEQGLAFQMMTEVQKRASFFETMQWSMFEDLIAQAGCQESETGGLERTMALLCLTAMHDVMKVEALLPIVQKEHAPYLGYEAGVVIRDHDCALSYLMEHFPSLLPSFAGLPPEVQKAVLFTQGKMNFNHGWFVQAEAPPGAMLCTLKSVLMAGATAADLGLYFLHWFTDLAGAEATPLGGAEKFVLKFPHAVLTSFLWSIPFLGKLETLSETAVVEQYLKARWRVIAPESPCPQDGTAIACMRLAVMAQSDDSVVEIFRGLPVRDRNCLAQEMAYTGCVDQRFCTSLGWGAGPAFLIYYGPALLQMNVESPRGLRAALRVLAEVMRNARQIWPLTREKEGIVVTIQVAELKTQSIEVVLSSAGNRPGGCWYLVRYNEREGAVEFRKDPPTGGENVGDIRQPVRYEVLNLSRCLHEPIVDESLLFEGEVFSEDDEDVNGVEVETAKSLSIISENAVERKGSRRASVLPFAADEESGLDTAVESGRAASLRQENWLLRDQVATLSDEVSRLRMRLSTFEAEAVNSQPSYAPLVSSAMDENYEDAEAEAMTTCRGSAEA
eukprot:CAMPEP_0176042820 /NCGR_PEP_ID=MMETSP0120_2-20121206/21248_1 /TAXON_ID=160619 /ORGANISM="Kryptoperidinium foliaceum, Strain CCMP 1326" /LENGTH=1104 /DNA_ID=CAMNT_0017376229 /DNA_START=55 /DNA_END=3367 /DNA_ORIENTATION=-